MLIRGDKLTPAQRAEVLRVFVHRWTHENARQTYGGRCPGCVQSPMKANGAWHQNHAPIVSDDEWIASHAFHFIANGSRLNARRHHAEPAYMATLAD